MNAHTNRGLIARLPPVRGRLQSGAPLGKRTWFRVGGPAEVLFVPADRDDLCAFLAAKPADVRVTVLGVCSNVLVRDGGVDGVVIMLGRGFMDIIVDGTTLVCGGGALDIQVARRSAAAGIAGLEFLSGVPGTIGGALRMNAGAYGRELVDVVTAAEAVDSAGRVHRLDKADLGLSYRRCAASDDLVFTEAVLSGVRGNVAEITARMAEIDNARQGTQPVRTRTGGSTFANPPGDKAWRLIDAAGCRGLRRGAAQVSEMHCNFLVNTGGATATDLEDLGEDVRRRVRDETGVTLEWEIRRVGRALPTPDAVKHGMAGS